MHSAYVWATRCTPAFSVCLIAVVLVYSFILEPYGSGTHGRHTGAATPWQWFLALYTVFLHIQSIVFPMRVTYAIGDVIRNIKEVAATKENSKRRKTVTIQTDEKEAVTFPSPLYVIILPAYKEDMDTLEGTLRVLASHTQARHSYHMYLAMEEKEEKAAFKAADLISTFSKSFYRMSYTIHPQGIPGEAQGKSSNESWAAKQACEDYPEAVKSNIIITVMDADTHLSSRYFSQITKLHEEYPDTNGTTMYVPPLVFDRNLHHVPLPVRTADLMWAGAGISSLYAGSRVCIPTSVYSLPMKLVEHVGGWDTDPSSIGEDLHMYVKCFFALSGNLTVRIVYAAASQCNVSSDVKGIHGYFDGLHARYKQALRHMWGSLDTGYALRQSVRMADRHRRASQSRMDLPLSAPNANWTAFYTSTGLHESLSGKSAEAAAGALPSPTPAFPPQPINKMNCLVLAHRLFEAHFLPIHLCTILTTSGIYNIFYPSFLTPTVLRVALEFSGWCRLIGFLIMLLFFHRYEKYHRLCVGMRQEEMRRAGLLDEMAEHDGFSPNVFQVAGLAEAALFPLGGFIFGAIPALHAVMSHVFTDRLTYVVSLKPQLAMRKYIRGGSP